MPQEPTAPPPEWHVAQHRVRNDLQTLASTLRLSLRRASADALVDAFPAWLNALAAVYDAQPLWQNTPRVPVNLILAALKDRCSLGVHITVEGDGPPTVPIASSLATALAALALLSWAAHAAEPGTLVQVNVRGDEEACRIETVFRSQEPEPPGWPPFALALTVEAMDAQCAMGQDGDDTVAVLMVPFC